MKENISLDAVLEMLELQKKRTILSRNSKNFKELQEKLKQIEIERQEVLKGNKRVIEKIIEEHN